LVTGVFRSRGGRKKVDGVGGKGTSAGVHVRSWKRKEQEGTVENDRAVLTVKGQKEQATKKPLRLQNIPKRNGGVAEPEKDRAGAKTKTTKGLRWKNPNRMTRGQSTTNATEK